MAKEDITDRQVIESFQKFHHSLIPLAGGIGYQNCGEMKSVSPSGHWVRIEAPYLGIGQIEQADLTKETKDLMMESFHNGKGRILLESCLQYPGNPTPNGMYYLDLTTTFNPLAGTSFGGPRVYFCYHDANTIGPFAIEVLPNDVGHDKDRRKLYEFMRRRSKETQTADAMILLALAKISVRLEPTTSKN